MKIEARYHPGLPNMALINAETGEEVAIVLTRATLPEDEQARALEAIAKLLGAKIP